MKKALVYYLYGTRNAGDMAICVGAVELLKKKGYSITMVSRFSEAEEEYHRSREYIQHYYPDVEVCPGPFSFERDFSRIRKLRAYAASGLKVSGILPDRKNQDLIREHDVVFFNGGNLLRGGRVTDYLRLTALFYPIELAKKMGKPVYCLPQSTAGRSTIGNQLLKHYLRGMQAVYVREGRSYEELRRAFPEIPFILGTDLAFFCDDSEEAGKRCREQFGTLPAGRRVALVLRGTGIGDIGALDPHLSEKMQQIMEEYITLHSSDRYYLVIQTLKDRGISERFYDRIKVKAHVEMVESHDPLVLRELYKQMDLMITMRLHAAILSLSARTPAAGIFSTVWGLKNPGIMTAYEMPYVVAEQDGYGNLDRSITELPKDVSEQIDKRICYSLESISLEEG